MTMMNPSPMQNASGTVRGVVSLVAQSFAGIKTFLSAVVLSAGLQVTGVLAASTNFLAILNSNFTGSIYSGNIKMRFGGGNNTSAPQATLDIINDATGKAVALVAGTASARIVYDSTSPFYFATAARSDLDNGGPTTTGTSVANFDTAFNFLLLQGHLDAQKGIKVTGVQPSLTRYLSTWQATSTDITTNGTAKMRFGFGSSNFPNPTLDIFNSQGKAISISASSNSARVAFDGSGNLTFTSVLRADMESDTVDWLFNGNAVSRLVILGSTGEVRVSSGGSLQTVDPNTWNKAQRGAVTALTSSAGSMAIDLAATNNFSHTLTENTTLAAPSNPTAGQSGNIVFTQHASSPKTLAYNSFWKFKGGTVPSLTATAGAVDVLTYYVCSAGFAICNLITDVK